MSIIGFTNTNVNGILNINCVILRIDVIILSAITIANIVIIPLSPFWLHKPIVLGLLSELPLCLVS